MPTFNDLIVEGDENFTITATLDGKTGTGTGIIVDKNLAPIVNDITVNVSEEGLKGGIKDNNGISDTTNETIATGKMIITDPNSDALNVVLVAPTDSLMAVDSNGNYANIIWSGTNTKELIGKVDNKEIIRVTIDNNGNYKVELLEPVKHPINSVEDIVSLNIGVKASDSELATVGKITVNIEDDMPIQCTISNEVEINIEKDLIIVKNLKAGFENAFFLNNTNTVNYVNNDNDAYNDRVDWGKSATGEKDRKSGYDLVDNKEYTTTSGSEVNPNGVFKLAQFTHENWALSSGESILKQATLVMNMDVVINGKVVNVSFDIVLGHNETPNDGADPRDIITLPSQNVFIKVDGENYVFTIEGFKDINGNYVKKIYTEEQADNVFDIYGSLKPVDSLLPKVIGNVCTEAGADGLDKVEWGDLNNPYGTMIVGANGGYVFTVNQATKDNLVVGKTLSQNFTYTITDKDGDTVTNSVTIKINGTSSPIFNNLPTSIDETNNLVIDTNVKTNIIVTLDVSGSMTDNSENVNRLAIAKDAIKNIIDKYGENGTVNVKVITFSDTGTASQWMTATAAKNYVNSLSAGGYTNYEDAVAKTYNNYSEPTADQTIAYFISDGEPTKENNSGKDVKNNIGTDAESGWLDTTYRTEWKNFVDTHVDKLYVIGVGTGITDTSYLNVLASAKNTNTIIVTNSNDLNNTLINTVVVEKTISGDVKDNIFDGDGVIKIDSIEIAGHSYKASDYTTTNIAIINDLQGKLEFNFSTGKYSYTTDSGKISDDMIKIFKVNASDIDGDTTSFDVKIKVDITPNETVTTIKIPDNDTIDLTSLISNNYKNVTDVIDMTGGKINTLKVEMKDVIDLVDADKELIIKGDLGDKVDLDKPSDWSNSGKEQVDGINYNVYKGIGTNSTIKLLIDDDIDVTL